MKENFYLGGVLGHAAVERMLDLGGADCIEKNDWKSQRNDASYFMHVRGWHFKLFSFGHLSVLIRGCMVPSDPSRSGELEQVADEVRDQYLAHGTIHPERWEGSFTLAVSDARSGRLLLYRNLVGNGFTYYTETGGGIVFGSNLAHLVNALGSARRPNRDVLPTFFLYRYVPGRETLFEGFYRLMPGELVTFDSFGLRRSQLQTLENLRETRTIGRDAEARIDETMRNVLAGYGAFCPDAANLLSGGVDSTYLQALGRRVWTRSAGGPPSFSITVDHPRTRPDTEYALSASQALGTRHTLVPADGPYRTYLLDTISGLAEPPNHVQAAYFGHLARAMVGAGSTTALCGEGGDGLFGMSTANQIHNAQVLRFLAPLPFLRQGGAALANAIGWERLHDYFQLADRLNDLRDASHPINRQAAFTHWSSVEACFGSRAVSSASASRRELLDHYHVRPSVLERLHAVNYLTSSIDSASLWTTLFNRAGGDLLCPFLDSRVLRVAVSIDPRHRFPFRKPKELLKRALSRHAPSWLAYRKKLGFGQPIFEWMAPGGQLRPLVEKIDRYDFLDRETFSRALAKPNWFLYSLLCYDLWHKLFIEGNLLRDGDEEAAMKPEAVSAM